VRTCVRTMAADSRTDVVREPPECDREQYHEKVWLIYDAVYTCAFGEEAPPEGSFLWNVVAVVARMTIDGTLRASTSGDAEDARTIVAPWRYLPEPGEEHLRKLVEATIGKMREQGMLA